MSQHPYYAPQTDAELPAWVQRGNFGPNGTYATKIDARGGGLVSCMFYSYPLIQSEAISNETTLYINTSALNASANGYEGVTVQQRLLNVVNNNVEVVWSNNVLVSGDDTKWFPFKTNVGEFTQRSIIEQPPAELAAPYLDIAIIVKAPSGYVIVSNVTNYNRYERIYPVPIEGPSQARRQPDDYQVAEVTDIWRKLASNAQTHVVRRCLWYLRTISVFIRKGERFVVEYDVIMAARTITLTSELSTVGVFLKLKRKVSGQHDSFEIVSGSEPEDPTAAGPAHYIYKKGMTGGVVAQYDYDQAEIILFARNSALPTAEHDIYHKGMSINIRTRGQSENG